MDLAAREAPAVRHVQNERLELAHHFRVIISGLNLALPQREVIALDLLAVFLRRRDAGIYVALGRYMMQVSPVHVAEAGDILVAERSPADYFAEARPDRRRNPLARKPCNRAALEGSNLDDVVVEFSLVDHVPP